MNILILIIALVVVGIVLALLRPRIDSTIFNLIIVLVVLAVCLWILAAFDLISLPSAFRIGKH